MGQAAIDLPDPLETLSTTTPANADDLLAQLAGSEIDRMLAEAGVERAPEGAEGAAGAEPPVVDEAEVAEQLEELFAELNRLDPDGRPQDPTALQDQVDQQLAEQEQEDQRAAEALLAEPEVVQAALAERRDPPPKSAVQPDAAKGNHAPQPASSRHQTSTSEHAAQRPATHVAAATVVAAGTAASPDAGTLPLYIKPLVWINLPARFMPPALREAMGKVAILTMLNALAVLLYVLIFRG